MIFAQQKMGKDVFRTYMLEHFLFGEKTGIDLPGEIGGLVRNLKNNNEVDFAAASFGQGVEEALTSTNIAFREAFSEGIKSATEESAPILQESIKGAVSEGVKEAANDNPRTTNTASTIDSSTNLQRYGAISAILFSSLNQDLEKLKANTDEVSAANIGLFQSISTTISSLSLKIPELISRLSMTFEQYSKDMEKLGYTAEQIGTVGQFQARKFAEGFQVAAQAISMVSGIMQASSQAKIAGIS